MCLAFKTTCIDAEKPLREGAFFFTRRALFLPLGKKNTRDKAKGLRVASERYIGKLGVRCLSTLNRAQDSRQQYPHRMRRREGEIASRPSRLRYFYPTGWRSSLLLSAGHTGGWVGAFCLSLTFEIVPTLGASSLHVHYSIEIQILISHEATIRMYPCAMCRPQPPATGPAL